MNNPLIDKTVLLVSAALALAAWSPTHAEPAKPSPSPAARAASGPQTYESFRLVHSRNVFDPDRRPVRPVGNYTPSPVTRADYAALTGTLLNVDKTNVEKSYAFFSGSRSEFNRVLAVRDKIANATITGITAGDIEIERDGKRTTIKVGQTVPFDNQTAPGTPPVEVPIAVTSTDGTPSGTPSAAPSVPATYRPAYAAAPATSNPPANSAAPKGPPSNIDDIRRRMMEKRQQELK